MTAPSLPSAADRTSPLRPLAAIVAYTLRTSLPGKRWVGILLPCGAAVLFGFLARGLDGNLEEEFTNMARIALFGLIMPVTCLVVGDAVLGAEVRSGSFTFTWLSPVPTWQIAVGRWLGGSVVASGCLAVAFAASALAAGLPEVVGPMVLATVFGAVTYVAVFLAIGSVAKRAAVWSLAFVFLVERLLGAALAGIAQLSPSWLARQAYVDFADSPGDVIRSGVPHGTAALFRLILITAVALLLASRRLQRMKLSGSAD